ncbi:MAG: arylsulfatase A-like enzyme [Verrucomicrobiales bacterium]|jgi:arylsulfatase A-like enzyme
MIQRLLLLLSLVFASAAAGQDAKPPNIVFIMSDELAYYELSHMGNPYIKTPNVDRMATNGLRFTQALAGSPVCAPLRCNLMTGKHAGHASVRANDGGTPLREGEATIASALKELGYATGGFGKWGAGGRDSTGVPEKHGFDIFYGYYDQVHAHSFYPPYLIRNSEEVVLEGNIGGRIGQTYSHYPIIDEGLKFIRQNADKPFFAYFPITPPHGMYDIPADDPAWEAYEGEEWIADESISQDVKNYAAMVTMIDNNLGTILELLKELDLEDNTIVFFTGDNGGQDRFPSKMHPRGFFGPNVDPKTGTEFRGGKGNLYEGGLRIPFLVQWPGKIEGGRVSDFIFFQPDMFKTIAELTGAPTPDDLDGISILPEILGKKQKPHDMLYWEYGSQTAVRKDMWKAIRPKPDAPWELYDLSKDVSETITLAKNHPDLLAEMIAYAEEAHTPVKFGTYSDPARARHQRDRWAKWGTTKDAPQPSGKVNKIKHADLIPFDELSLIRFSSENRSNDRQAIYAIDGKPNTVWHSRWDSGIATPPHELVIDLGEKRDVSGFVYLGRQDSGWNGAFAKTEFFVSDSADEFPKKPATKATFKKVKEQQVVDLKEAVSGRYVLIRALSEVGGNAYGSAADVGVLAK